MKRHYNFRIGQEVYVLGRFRAKVKHVSWDGRSITCEVYEGLSDDKKKETLTYGPGLVEATLRPHQSATENNEEKTLSRN